MGKYRIAPNNEAISYDDCVRVGATAEEAVFDRIIAADHGIGWDSPNTRIRFRTDARSVTAHFFYDARHTHVARNGRGVILVGGEPVGHFECVERPGALVVEVPAVGRAALYELVLPYADSVRFRGLEANKGARFEDVPPRPVTRWIAYGDSITQGYLAGDATTNYPSRIAAAKGWQLLNMGFGTRQATPSDGPILAELPKANLITILMGTNDTIAAKPADIFAADVAGVIAGIRARHPVVPIYVITPLGVPGENWGNMEARQEPLRAALRALVPASGDANLHLLEGPELIPREERYFADGLHPNDVGFEEMAGRLCRLLPEIP